MGYKSSLYIVACTVDSLGTIIRDQQLNHPTHLFLSIKAIVMMTVVGHFLRPHPAAKKHKTLHVFQHEKLSFCQRFQKKNTNPNHEIAKAVDPDMGV